MLKFSRHFQNQISNQTAQPQNPLEHQKGSTFVYHTFLVRLTNVLRTGTDSPVPPSAPKKRKRVKLHHDDGVGGMLRYESETSDDYGDGAKQTLKLLADVNIKLAELQARIARNDQLIAELDSLIDEHL